MLFPITDQERIHKTLKGVGGDSTFKRLESIAGHDAFLIELDFFKDSIAEFL